MDVLWFLLGFGILLGLLAAIGITRNQFMSQKTWVILWTIISFSFAAFILISSILGVAGMVDAALGGSFGFVVAISIHVAHHTIEEIQKSHAGAEKKEN